MHFKRCEGGLEGQAWWMGVEQYGVDEDEDEDGGDGDEDGDEDGGDGDEDEKNANSFLAFVCVCVWCGWKTCVCGRWEVGRG